jgi:hypothetical protein
MKFIEVKDIRVGDTIAWNTQKATDCVSYMTVENIEESEDNFRYYDDQGVPVFSGEEYACYSLYGKVISKNGVRTNYAGYPGPYKLSTDFDNHHILLISRKE